MASFATDPATAESSLGSSTLPADPTRLQSAHAADHAANGTSADPDTDNDTPGKKKKGTKRRKVNHACLYCRRSHMTCDEGRPCQRWCAFLLLSPRAPFRPAPSPRPSQTESPRLTCPSPVFSLPSSPVLRSHSRRQHQARNRPPLPRRAPRKHQGQAPRRGSLPGSGRRRSPLPQPRRHHEPAHRRREGAPGQVSLAYHTSRPDGSDERALRLFASVCGAHTAAPYGSASVPMNATWPGMAQGAWLYPPETFSNEFSVLS